MSCTFPAICSASACEILSARDLPSNRTLCLLYGSGAERRVECPWSTGATALLRSGFLAYDTAIGLSQSMTNKAPPLSVLLGVAFAGPGWSGHC